MDKQPVSIIVLTYYRLDFLKTFIEMIHLLTSYPFLLYVINNAKEDKETIYFLEKMEKENLIHKHLTTEKNIPLAAALTLAFNTFHDELGEYIITVANDMTPPIFKPFDWLEMFVNKMESDKDIGCINLKGVRQSYDSFQRKDRPLIEKKIRETGGELLDKFNNLEKVIHDR